MKTFGIIAFATVASAALAAFLNRDKLKPMLDQIAAGRTEATTA